MGRKNKYSRRAPPEPASSSPASARATAPPSSRSATTTATAAATPSSPSSSYSKCVSLIDWWLVKSDTDSDGKRLAVGGFHPHGQHAIREFTSAPIVTRYDAYTLKTADGITVRIQGFINKPLTHHNGFPPEVTRCFLVGFPYNWDHYADANFGSKPTSSTISMRSSGIDKQSQDGAGSGIAILLAELLGALNSSLDTSTDDELRRNLAFTRRNPGGCSSVNTSLHAPSGLSSCHLSVATQPLETSRNLEMDRSNQNHEKSVRCANGIGHNTVGNATGHAEEASCSRNDVDGVHGESSATNNRVIMNPNTSLTANEDCLGQHETGRSMQSETSLPKATELEKHNNLARSVAANFDPVANLPNDKQGKLNDESTTSSMDLIVEGVSYDLSARENIQQCNQQENYAVKLQNHAEKTRVQGVGVFEDLPRRKDSVGKDSDSLTVKVSLPLEASFKSPPAGAARNTNNESTPNSAGLAFKIGSVGSSPNVTSLLYLKYGRRLGDYALRSQNRAERIRVHGIGDSEVLGVKTNRNEADSSTFNTDMALQTARKSSANDMERSQNNNHTINSANSAVERVSNNVLPTERNDTHHQFGSRQGGYALRSRDHVGKSGVENTGVSEDSLGRKDTNRNKADSLTVNTYTAKSSPNDKKQKPNNNQTIDSADSAVERVSNNLLPTERDASHHKFGSRRGGYALRSRDHVGKFGVETTGVSEDSLGRKDSEKSDTDSFGVEMSVPFEPLRDLDARKLCKYQNKKGKGYNSRLEVENELISVTVEQNYINASGGVEQCGQKYAHSLVSDCVQEGNLISSIEEPSSKHHCEMPASPNVINKKRVNHSDHIVSVRKSSKNESFKTFVQCSVKHAIHSDGSVGIHSDKASDITGKQIEELPNNQDGNQSKASTEAHLTKKKTLNTSKQKTVWRPSYSQESPLTRDKAKKLSVTSPELLNLKRSRSGRLLVPSIDKWRQGIIYDMDGSVTGITGLDVLNSPCKGSKSEPPKRRKHH